MTTPLPKSGKIKFTRTVIYDIDELRDEYSDAHLIPMSDDEMKDTLIDWLVEDMTVPISSDTVIVTNENGEELQWIF